MTRASFSLAALFLVLPLAAVGCGGSQATSSSPDTPVSHTTDPDAPPPPDDAPATDDPSATDCPPGSHPHEGPPEGCDFVVDGCCWSTAEQACAAAGCEPDACVILESYPAQIRCEAQGG